MAVEALQANGRITNAELARRNGLAPSSMLERVRKLEERGVVAGYETRLDPRSLNLGLLAFIFVGTSERAGQVQSYRRMAWDAFRRGWNGWAFYAYYAPRGNPWDDFDKAIYGEDMMDYLMIYPGPRGPVPTRQTESVREGWEDYRLLSLLKQQGKAAKVAALLDGYAKGESLEQLRNDALLAAAGDPR